MNLAQGHCCLCYHRLSLHLSGTVLVDFHLVNLYRFSMPWQTAGNRAYVLENDGSKYGGIVAHAHSGIFMKCVKYHYPCIILSFYPQVHNCNNSQT